FVWWNPGHSSSTEGMFTMVRSNYLSLVAALVGLTILGGATPVRASFQLTVREYTSAGTAVGSAQTFNQNDTSGDLGLIFGAIGSTTSFKFNFSASQNSATTDTPTLHLDTFSIGTNIVTTNYIVIAVSEGGASTAGFTDNGGWNGPVGPAVVNSSLA